MRCCTIITLGTDQYIAPEAYLGEYSPASDVFALGCILYIVLSGQFPYPPELFKDTQAENIRGHPSMARLADALRTHKVDYTPLRCYGQKGYEAYTILRRMMHVKRSKRATLKEVLAHSWLSKCDA